MKRLVLLAVPLLIACGEGSPSEPILPGDTATVEVPGDPVASSYWVEGGSDYAADSLVISKATATITDSAGVSVPWTLASLTDEPVDLHDRGEHWTLTPRAPGYGGVEVLVEGERWLIAKTVVCDIGEARYVAWYHSSGEADVPC